MQKTVLLHVRCIVFTHVGDFILHTYELCFVHTSQSLDSIFDCLSVSFVKGQQVFSIYHFRIQLFILVTLAPEITLLIEPRD